MQFSWYTKRALVSKIYATSEVYMMQDKSADKQATWDFIERRIKEVMQIGQLINKNKDLAQVVGGGIQSIIEGVIPSKINDKDILEKQAQEK